MILQAAALLGALVALAPASVPSPELTPESLVHVPAVATQTEMRARYGQALRVIDTEHFRVISDTSPRAHRVIAAQLEQFYRSVHPRFFRSEIPRLTVCLIHGGADYQLFERGRVVRGHWIYGNPNPMREAVLRRAYDAGRLPRLAAYFQLSDEAFTANGGLAYSVGRSLFLYLLRSHGEGAIRRFIAARRANESPLRALGSEWTMERLEQSWRQSVVAINFAGDYPYRARGSKALEILQEGAARYPGYGNLQAALAQELARRGELGEAAAHARAALRDPRCTEAPLAWSTLGYALWKQDSGAACMAFRTALRYQPWNEEVMDYEYSNLARLTEAGGDPATAARLRAELAAMQAQSKPSGCSP